MAIEFRSARAIRCHGLCIDAARRGLSGIEGLEWDSRNCRWRAVDERRRVRAGDRHGRRDCSRRARRARCTRFPEAKCSWNYRHTSFREGELLLGATLAAATRRSRRRLRARMEKAKGQRMSTQPHGTRSAGCFFKNAPASPVGTGKMIDDLGMKGHAPRWRGRFAEAREFHCHRRRGREGFRRAGAGRRDSRASQTRTRNRFGVRSRIVE